MREKVSGKTKQQKSGTRVSDLGTAFLRVWGREPLRTGSAFAIILPDSETPQSVPPSSHAAAPERQDPFFGRAGRLPLHAAGIAGLGTYRIRDVVSYLNNHRK